MSLASYIGCNKELPVVEENTDDLIYIGRCFANVHNLENVKNYQYYTVCFEVSSHWGIKISEYTTPEICAESKKK